VTRRHDKGQRQDLRNDSQFEASDRGYEARGLLQISNQSPSSVLHLKVRGSLKGHMATRWTESKSDEAHRTWEILFGDFEDVSGALAAAFWEAQCVRINVRKVATENTQGLGNRRG
jgi:hypothetical protein